MPSYFCIFLLFYTHLASASQVKSCADRPFQCLNSSEAQSCDLRKPAVTYQHNARMLVVSWAKIVSGLSDEYWRGKMRISKIGISGISVTLCIPHHPTTTVPLVPASCNQRRSGVPSMARQLEPVASGVPECCPKNRHPTPRGPKTTICNLCGNLVQNQLWRHTFCFISKWWPYALHVLCLCAHALVKTFFHNFRWIKQKPFETFTPSDIVAVEHFALGVGSCSRCWTAAISWDRQGNVAAGCALQFSSTLWSAENINTERYEIEPFERFWTNLNHLLWS